MARVSLSRATSALAKGLARFVAVAAVALAIVHPTAAQSGAAPAQEFVLEAKQLDGSRVALRDGRGRTSLVVLWAPDSLASRKSIGELQRFADSARGKEVFLLAISMSGDAATVGDFMTARRLDFPVALRERDPFGAIALEQLPVAIVFDAEGRSLRRRDGLFTLKTLLGLTAR